MKPNAPHSKCGREHRNEVHPHSSLRVVDIGINLTNKAFRNNWKDVIKQLGKSIDRPFEEVCNITTETAVQFFYLKESESEIRQPKSLFESKNKN